MRIIIYPETRRSTIGRFDEPDVETCVLLVSPKADLDLIPKALDFCTQILNPLRYMPELGGQIHLAEISEKSRGKLAGAEVIARISREDLLALVPAREKDPEKALLSDIQQMAQTANDLMEVAPEVYPPDQVLREDMLSVGRLTDGICDQNLFGHRSIFCSVCPACSLRETHPCRGHLMTEGKDDL